ncbi:MAG TPA: DNA-binding protein YbiB, partial [Burkholderiales bacterium]
ALLDDGLPELEQGAALALLEVRACTLPLLVGFHSALQNHCFDLQPPRGRPRPVLLATHRAPRRRELNQLPLLALLLQRLGMTVLVHGSLEGAAAAGSAHVFRELGIMPCASLVQAQSRLDGQGLAFVPTAVLAPGLAALAARCTRLSGTRLAHLLARILDPYGGAALHVVATGGEAQGRLLASFFQLTDKPALLLEGTEGEPFASARRRPALEFVHDGGAEMLFPAEAGNARRYALPSAVDVRAASQWTSRALRGELPLPLPLVNQVACCLYGTGHASDINQAKAIAALETGSLVTA